MHHSHNTQVIQTKSKQRKARAGRHYKPDGPIRQLQNTSPKNKRVYLFLLHLMHGTISKLDSICGHKASLNRYKKKEITS